MKKMIRVVLGLTVALLALSAQELKPTCKRCDATYVPLDEIQAYVKRAIDNKIIDQQIRSVDLGKTQLGVGVVYRGKLAEPAKNSVAEHDLISEVYHVIDGSATLVTGWDIVDPKRRPSTLQTVREFNGPGSNGAAIRNGKTYNLKPGDVIVIPAGVGHQFTRIDDHITYLMVRVDPDKAVPLKNAQQSQDYLRSPAKRGGE
jgi:mannose-6-phosphate isomerase-like protein (cupin superfamily)